MDATFENIRRVFREARAAADNCELWADRDTFDPDTGYALIAAPNGISVVSQRSSASTRRSADMRLYSEILSAAGFTVQTTTRGARTTAVKVIR